MDASTLMSTLLREIERLRAWSATIPVSARGGEWEESYPNCGPLYDAVLEFVDGKPSGSWSPEETSAVLFAIARDNETQKLAREIRDRGAELLLGLVEASILFGEPDAKWQLAEELGNVACDPERRERLLLTLAHDDNEYVRRRSLKTLASIGSPATEQAAMQSWSRPDESQEYSRMMALWALSRIRSPRLESLLAEAERDQRPHLSSYASKLRRGEVED